MSANVGNITITTEDLKKVRPDLAIYLNVFEGQTDFANQISLANAQEYRNIASQLRREYPTYTEAEINNLIELIKDNTVEQALYQRRVFMTLVEIFSGNNALDEAEYYQKRVDAIPLHYYIDQNNDDVVGVDESRNIPNKRITFGR
jgi:hypothetical protein